MIPVQYTEDQYDMLKEVVNVAMGQAGSDLAAILKSFVDLTVPEIKIVEAEKVVETVLRESVFGENDAVNAFRQSFSNMSLMDGEAVVVFDNETRERFSDFLGLSEKMDSVEEIEFMLELTNLMVGACMNSISEQLFDQDMSFSPPALISENKPLNRIAYETFKRRNLKWDYSLLAKITFNLKDKSFKSDLLILLSEKAVEAVSVSIDKLLEEF